MAPVEIHAVSLTIGSFVPVETYPLHSFNNGLDRFVGRATLVGILDAKDKDTLLLPSIEPVKQRRPDAADMEKPCWTGGKTDTNLCHACSSLGVCEGRYL